MSQRHEDPMRDEHGRPLEGEPGREFYRGNHGFQDSHQSGYAPGQPGAGAAYYGASQYTAGAHAPGQYEGAGFYPGQQGPWPGQQQGGQCGPAPYGGGPYPGGGGPYPGGGGPYPGGGGQYGRRSGQYESWTQAAQGRGFSSFSPPFAQQSFGHAPFGQRRRFPTGPKGYQRSDERLREDISERLMQSEHIDSSEVTVQVLGGKVILEGTVPGRYMKHEIEDLADAAPGVQDVENRIRVSYGQGSPTSAGAAASGAPASGAPEIDGR